MVDRVAAGWPAAHVAEQLGVSRATVHKWVRRFAEGGQAALAD
jgi:transposase